MKEKLLLELRNAIADKEWVIACANMETAKNESWSCDWYQGMSECQDRIEDILAELNALED